MIEAMTPPQGQLSIEGLCALAGVSRATYSGSGTRRRPGPRRRRSAMCSSGWPSTIGTTGIDASLRSYGAMAGR